MVKLEKMEWSAGREKMGRRVGKEKMEQVLNVKGVSRELMKGVRAVANERDMSVGEFVVECLALGIGAGPVEPQKVRKEKPVEEKAVAEPEPVIGEPPKIDKRTEFNPAEFEGKPGKKSQVRKEVSLSEQLSTERAECKRCGKGIGRDPKNRKYWHCPTCRRQYDDGEVEVA
jgi:hypothetical protein